MVTIPQQMSIPLNKEHLIHFVYPNITQGLLPKRHCLLAPHHDSVTALNDTCIQMFPGNTFEIHSIDQLDEDTVLNPPLEFLHTIRSPGLSLHTLTLKIGMAVMVITNLSLKNKITNGSIFILKRVLHRSLLIKNIDTGSEHYLPRITLKDDSYPFKWSRSQYPLFPLLS